MPNHAEQLAQELNLNVKNVQGAIELIDQGNTIPFIARYRKEATGSMDDQVPVSYTHLDVYKRQVQERLLHMLVAGDVREDAQLDLGVVGVHQCLALPSHKVAA